MTVRGKADGCAERTQKHKKFFPNSLWLVAIY